MGFATLDDKNARVDVAIYSDTFENYKDLLKADEVLVGKGSARNRWLYRQLKCYR